MKIGSILFGGLLTVAALVIGLGSWGTIDTGNRGIVLNLGKATGEIKGEGFFWKTPIFESIKEVSVRTWKVQDETEAASKDLQQVNTTVALNISQSPSAVAAIYQQYGTNWDETFVDPALKESQKAVIARFTAEQLVTQREQVRGQIADLVRSKLEPKGFHVEAANIVNLRFSDSFNHAIEAKVTAEQNALAAQNKLAQVQFEAQQAAAEANGRALAITAESNALRSNPQILQLRAIEKWDGKLPSIIGGGATPFINVPTGSDVSRFTGAKVIQ